MTTAPTPDLRALAEAAEGNGEHIYTHPRDSNKWRENEAWHRAASPGAVLHLLDRIHELEMQALDLASENSILKRAEVEELEARKPLPPDALADKCETWLQAGGAANIVDAFEAGYRAAEET